MRIGERQQPARFLERLPRLDRDAVHAYLGGKAPAQTRPVAQPRTASELVPVLFRRQLDTHQLGFAIGETLAHLHFLEAEGQVARLLGEDGIERFRKA